MVVAGNRPYRDALFSAHSEETVHEVLTCTVIQIGLQRGLGSGPGLVLVALAFDDVTDREIGHEP